MSNVVIEILVTSWETRLEFESLKEKQALVVTGQLLILVPECVFVQFLCYVMWTSTPLSVYLVLSFYILK